MRHDPGTAECSSRTPSSSKEKRSFAPVGNSEFSLRLAPPPSEKKTSGGFRGAAAPLTRTPVAHTGGEKIQDA